MVDSVFAVQYRRQEGDFFSWVPVGVRSRRVGYVSLLASSEGTLVKFLSKISLPS